MAQGKPAVGSVLVAADLLAPGRLPEVSVVSGEPAARPVPVEARSRPWWPWLLLLAGPIGVLLLVAFYPRTCERRTVWLPVSAGDLERARERLRRCWWGLGVAVLLVAGGVGVLALGTTTSWDVGAVLVVLGVVVGLVVAFVADRVARPVRLTLRSGGASVVVHRAHATFVAEAARRWE